MKTNYRMRLRNRTLFSCLIFSTIVSVTFLVIGCKKDSLNEPKEDDTNKEFIINENVFIVSDGPLEPLLEKVARTELIFSPGSKETDQIKVGSFLVAGIINKAPNGFLRKVVSITEKPGQKVLTTVDAKLTDVIVRGKIHFVKEITDDDIVGMDTSGAEVVDAGKPQDFVLGGSFRKSFNEVLFDLDGKLSTKGDRVNLKGSIDVRSTLTLDLEIDDLKVKKFSLVAGLSNDAKLELSSEIGMPEIKEERDIFKYQLRPITFFIGIVPVVLTNRVVFLIGLDGKISAKIECSILNEYHCEAGMVYENQDWNSIKEQTNQFSGDFMDVKGKVIAEPWLMLRYEMRPYDIPAIRFNIGARGSMIAETTTSPRTVDWELKFGSKLNALVQMNFLGNNLLDYEAIFYEKEFPISSGSIEICDGTLSLFCGPIQGGTDYELPINVNFPACGGAAPYKYKLDDGSWQNSSVLAIRLWGTHTIRVQDANGCEATRQFTITN